MKSIFRALVLILAFVGAARADQCDNVGNCTSQPAGAATNFQLLNATGTAPALNGFTLIPPATAVASCTALTVTFGAQAEADCQMTANSTITLALPSTPVVGANAIMPLRIRACQDASTGAHSLTVTSTGITNGIAWTQDGGTQPQPSQAVSACTLYRMTYSANLAKVIEDTPAMLAVPTPLAAVETCPGGSFLFGTSTTGGGSGDCSAVAFSGLTGAATTGQMPSNPAISATNSVGGKAGSAQNVIFNDAPSWMHYFGDGSEADPGPNSFSVQGTHNYANLTINAGQTITVTDVLSTVGSATDKPNAGFIAYVQGTCTIAGTIAANGIFAESSNFGGASSGGGGFGAANGTIGNSASLPGNGGAVAIATAGAAGTTGVAGTAGSTPDASAIKDVVSGPLAWGNCGGAKGGAGGSSGGAGGAGGGCVALICNSINFTGTINVAGAAGGAGGANVGPGGGGGGGFVLLTAHSLTNSGTITTTAGAAGAAGSGTATAAGAGGAGYSKTFTLN